MLFRVKAFFLCDKLLQNFRTFRRYPKDLTQISASLPFKRLPFKKPLFVIFEIFRHEKCRNFEIFRLGKVMKFWTWDEIFPRQNFSSTNFSLTNFSPRNISPVSSIHAHQMKLYSKPLQTKCK